MMNKSQRSQILSAIPSLTARTMSYRNHYIVCHNDPEGRRYVVTTLTGHVLKVTRKLTDAQSFVNAL